MISWNWQVILRRSMLNNLYSPILFYYSIEIFVFNGGFWTKTYRWRLPWKSLSQKGLQRNLEPGSSISIAKIDTLVNNNIPLSNWFLCFASIVWPRPAKNISSIAHYELWLILYILGSNRIIMVTDHNRSTTQYLTYPPAIESYKIYSGYSLIPMTNKMYKLVFLEIISFDF